MTLCSTCVLTRESDASWAYCPACGRNLIAAATDASRKRAREIMEQSISGAAKAGVVAKLLESIARLLDLM